MEIYNKKAKFDYFIEDEYEAGIVLTGTEIKSVRSGKCNIKDCYGIVKNNEIFLINMFISHYKEGNIFNHEETRSRKLLLHKKEIAKLIGLTKQKGYSLVPISIYFKGSFVKIELGIGKGKKLYDKRQDLAKKDAQKQMAIDLKNKQ